MKIVSLFSGAGGMDLGFVRAGHEVVWANDHDRDCVITYCHNIGNHIVHGDISNIDATTIPDCDVVVGGFPCQGFSRANLRRSAGDERNALYLEFIRVLEAKRPQYFVAENVRGILSLDNGQVMEMLLGDFSSFGYNVTYKLFNAADFGVPQTRMRVIIIGTRADVDPRLRPSFPLETHTKTPLPGCSKAHWVSISEALKDVPEPSDPDHKLLNHVGSKYKVTDRNFTGHRMTDPNKPAPTILARGNGKGGVCAIQHPRNHRRMSVRESALIQTFPLNFEFFGKLNSMYRQVGNAVPVLFAQKIGEEFSKIELLERAR